MNRLRPFLPELFFLLLVFCAGATFAQAHPIQIPLWENGAPGYENRKNEPEQARDWWVKNVHNPSITVYRPPAGKANGTAVLICPGGGHRALVYNAEGRDPALFLNDLGVTAFVLKYRLAREEHSVYRLDKEVKQDADRAMRLIRSRSKEWKIDTAHLGMLGFSAGGEVVDMIAFEAGKGDMLAADPVEHFDARPNFVMLIYPGPYAIPDTLPQGAPPAFLLVAEDDSCCSGSVMKLLHAYRQARIPVEAHVYAQGSHGFNMGYRSNLQSLRSWPQRMADWLEDMHLLTGKEAFPQAYTR
jgi:acetyl esterase/lipase